MKKILYVLLLWLPFGTMGQSTFTVTTNGTTIQMDNAIDYATDIWSQYLNSTIPIKVNVIFTDLGDGGTNGVCLSNIRNDFTGAPNPTVTYNTSLANAISGTELNAGEFDMDIYMNSSTNWYFGLDGSPSGAQFDFVTVFMHEIAHGLGGVSFAKVENGLGSFGMITVSDIPLPTSFTVNFEPGAPTVWDNFLVNGLGQNIADSSIFPNQTTALAAEIQSNDIYFSGTNAKAANGGENPKIYAPAVWTLSSSMHHFDEDTFPVGSDNELFTPFSNPSDAIQIPGPILLGALKDLGWSINEVLGLDKHVINQTARLYPNPAKDYFNIYLDSGLELKQVNLYNIQGQYIFSIKSHKVDIQNLQSGMYVMEIETNQGMTTKKLVVK
ncbi:T9SS type A sorting domain-containing protein [Tamlana flava]|uniref:T9SS type A sorting domain-containing protein n=1 Tax=Tamlana flava TaxID=3158572 RepID=UPI00351B27C9